MIFETLRGVLNDEFLIQCYELFFAYLHIHKSEYIFLKRQILRNLKTTACFLKKKRIELNELFYTNGLSYLPIG